MNDRVGSRSDSPPPERIVTVLTVCDSAEDLEWLRSVFDHSKWKMLSAGSCREAFEILQNHRVSVVVSDCILPDGTWKSLLSRFAQSPEEPLLIVTSRQADDRLWAEVLNLGGYDVLSKPFERSEVVRVIGAAWLQWRQRRLAPAVHHAAAEMAFRAIA